MLGMKFQTKLVKCKNSIFIKSQPNFIINQFFNDLNFFTYSEALKDEEDFPEKELAASVASKVFYYLEEYDEALKFALEAGTKFNLTEDSKYVETLIHKCIDQYIDKRKRQYDRQSRLEEAQKDISEQDLMQGVQSCEDDELMIDPRMENVINRMFDKCYADNQYNQAIGIAIESRRLDKLREAIERSSQELEAKLGYTFQIAQKIIKSKKFRTEILRLLLTIYEQK